MPRNKINLLPACGLNLVCARISQINIKHFTLNLLLSTLLEYHFYLLCIQYMQDTHFFIIVKSREVGSHPTENSILPPMYLQIRNDDRTCQFTKALYFTDTIKHHHRAHLFCIKSFIFPFIININKLTLFSISNTTKTQSNWTYFAVIP